MKVLVDTSVWIRHLRSADEKLSQLLSENQVLVHPFIIGEVFVGHVRNRDEVMELLGFLPQISIAQDKEVQQFVTKQRLFGRGLGWIDCHLLAACRLHGSELYTLDRALMTAFKEIAD